MATRKNQIDFKNVEKLVLAESQRRKVLWEQKSKKLVVIVMFFLLIISIFLK